MGVQWGQLEVAAGAWKAERSGRVPEAAWWHVLSQLVEAGLCLDGAQPVRSVEQGRR